MPWDKFKWREKRRRLGQLARGTPEWRLRISIRTREAMANPAIRSLLKKPRKSPSLQRRKRHSDLLAGRMPANMMWGNNAYPNVQRGDYDINGQVIYFRSKWEANYALYLDFLLGQKQIKSWEFEPDVFIFHKVQFGTRSYRPDFRVTNLDGTVEYHEVKGYMDGRSRTKLRRMRLYYPKIKIILIERKFYEDIKKKLGKMLGFY